MVRGKQTCKILKDIRRQIAEANDIEYITSECQYKGDCTGTCPKCESEVRIWNINWSDGSWAGKAITLLGCPRVIAMKCLRQLTRPVHKNTSETNLSVRACRWIRTHSF